MSALPAPQRAHDPEPALLDRARAGDPDAFAALLQLHDAGLRALAFRLLGDRDRMDDALQEAYVKAFRGLARFRGGAALGTWLYRIAYNACLDELERSRRVPSISLEAAYDRPLDGPEVAERVAARSALSAALAGLSPQDRAAVLLVDAHGLDYGEAAEVLGVPAGTVGSRLHRARAALRRALAADRKEQDDDA